MIPWARLALAVAVAACAGACLFPDVSKLSGDAGTVPDAQNPADSGDAGIADGDAATPVCDPSKPFNSIAPVAELDDGDDQYKATLSPDELEIWYGFTHTFDGGNTVHILHAKRAQRTDPFGTPVLEANIAPGDVDPSVTDDALGLYFSKFGSVGDWDIFYASRATRSDSFGIGAQLPNSIQSTGSDTAAFIAFDGSLWFASSRSGGNHIWTAAAADGGFAAPVMVNSLSSNAADNGVVLTRDGLWAYVSSNRTDLGSSGSYDIFVAHRSTISDGFGTPTNATELNGSGSERANWISWDNCRLYFESSRSGSQDLFLATKLP